MTISSAVQPAPKIARALKCNHCEEKRTVVQFSEDTRWAGPRVKYQLCAACILEALQLLIGKNIKRGSRIEQRQRKKEGR